MKIAIIGGGVSGISSAMLLQEKHEITLFEKNNYVGGHTNTILVEDEPNKKVAVDTGFIVCNDWTYPNLHKMFKKLKVAVRDTDMSFGFADEKTGYCYSGKNANGLFAQRKNIFNPRFWLLLKEVVRFNNHAKADLAKGIDLSDTTMRDYLSSYSFSKHFILDYLVPIGGAIWSSSNKTMLDFPADLFLHFFKNHGLLNIVNRPQWQTVVGGSFAYIKKFRQQFKGAVHTDSPVKKVKRENGKAILILDDSKELEFDAVVFACHADEVLNILGDASSDEKNAFADWDYIPNHTVLHTDESVMPKNKRAWASWNFTQERNTPLENPISLTYDMNNLQGLESKKNYFVSLNRINPIPKEHVLKEFSYKHPNFTVKTLASKKKIENLNGLNHTYFVGSYLGYGFHEDAVKSSVDMTTRHFGLTGF